MARWHSCNIFQPDKHGRHLWQFHLGGERLKLAHQEIKGPADPLNAKLITKDWQTLYQKKLNVACLPPDKLFLRAVQIPAADFNEARSMVELQLEKLSPIPVQQIVWSFELLPSHDGPLRTAIVIVAPRDYVEAFLGKIEEQGYLADRLEIPFLDQLTATKITGSGAWIYPGFGADQRVCLVAWWYDGVLQNLSLINVPPDPEAGRYLREQLAQMAWAGELEGWLTSPPRWHLVATPEQTVTWEPWLREDGTAVDVIAPVPPAELAVLTAHRATRSEPRENLLPPEYLLRYRQRFIDRIWMRALGAVVMVLVFGTLIYMGALQYLRYQVSGVETTYAAQSAGYTNAMKLKAEVEVMQDQLDLQYAALECWKAVATLLPSELTLQGVNFHGGKALTVFGTGPADASSKALDYNEALRQFVFKDEPLFTKVETPHLSTTPGGMRWNLNAELKRKDTE